MYEKWQGFYKRYRYYIPVLFFLYVVLIYFFYTKEKTGAELACRMIWIPYMLISATWLVSIILAYLLLPAYYEYPKEILPEEYPIPKKAIFIDGIRKYSVAEGFLPVSCLFVGTGILIGKYIHLGQSGLASVREYCYVVLLMVATLFMQGTVSGIAIQFFIFLKPWKKCKKYRYYPDQNVEPDENWVPERMPDSIIQVLVSWASFFLLMIACKCRNDKS
ncbi:MAG: hypothetical protein IJ147_10760 [Lachnospiraceae bacterium]|nr:hypothetical protein [Lachnospiraceae bacterium]